MALSSESSDSSDLEILKNPLRKPRGNTTSGSAQATTNANISTQIPKVILRVEIVDDAEADLRFRQNGEEVVMDEANTSKDNKAATTQPIGQVSTHNQRSK
jgi:hypothetical protein